MPHDDSANNRSDFPDTEYVSSDSRNNNWGDFDAIRSNNPAETGHVYGDHDTVNVDPHTQDRVEPDIYFDVSCGFDRYTNYAPIVIDKDILCYTGRDLDYPVNRFGSQFNVPAWDHEISFENDTNLFNYITYGVHNGFLIVDENAKIPSYKISNYGPVVNCEAYSFVDALIKRELLERKLVYADDIPHCVHGLGAVPKKGNKWHPITDCSRPVGSSVNSHMSSTFREFCYSTVDQVVELIQPEMYMASVNISAAYRSVMIHPSQ